MKSLLLMLFAILLSANNSFSQNLNLGSLNVLNVKYNVREKWSVFGEAQLRSLKFYSNLHYYELKGGINYKIHKNVVFTVGAGSYQTYKEGGNFVLPKNNNEFRIWPQIILFQTVGKLKIEQRYRTELRFTSNGYRSRFRYRAGLSYPFGKEKKEYKPFQCSVSDEIFFTDKEPYFERNRFLVAFNYKPSKRTTLQIGYLTQFDYKIFDETGRDFLQVGIYIELFSEQSLQATIENDIKDN
jgi:hypothetical protein